MIIDLQRRIAEIGRIRIGQQVATGRGKTRPEKLTTFRITSPDPNRIKHAAHLYGGQPQEWDAPAGKQWEVVTEATALPVIVPPSDMAFSQSYELWSGGGCQRRCDGQSESISDGPCLCDPDNRECKPHTRLSVMLRDLPGLGVWRLDTQGWYAALELQGAVEVIQMAAGRGQMLPAQLRLEQRMTKRPGQGTRRFAVPVLDIEISPAQLMGTSRPALSDPGVVAIEGPRAPSDGPRQIDGASPITPVPETVPESPVASIADQAVAPKQRRKSTQQPIPSTGVKPRTAAQAASNQGGQPSESGPKPEPAQVSDPPADDGGPSTGAQNKQLNGYFTEAELSDKPLRKQAITALLGYEVAALTAAEADQIIAKLSGWQAEGVLFDRVWDLINPPNDGPVDAEAVEMITDPQKTKLAIQREERYAKTDKGRRDWFAWVATQIGRQIASNTELTKAEAHKLIDVLDPAPEPPPEQ